MNPPFSYRIDFSNSVYYYEGFNAIHLGYYQQILNVLSLIVK